MPPSNNRTQRKSPRDLTGLRGQRLAEEAAASKAHQQDDVSAALAAEAAEKRNTEVDYSTHRKAPQEVEIDVLVEVDGEVTTQKEVTIEEVEVEIPTRRIRVSDDIQDMTFGKSILADAVYDKNGVIVSPARVGGLNTYNFERGRWYTVDKDLADHLEYLGYVVDY